MSNLVDCIVRTAAESDRGFVTGARAALQRQTWGEVHEQARRVTGTLESLGLGPGSAVAVLAAEPALVAPAAQGAWLAGCSLTMLHQPTARTDLVQWTDDTLRVIGMIGARVVLIDDVFAGMASLLSDRGIPFQRLSEIVRTGPDSPGSTVGESQDALLQLTSGTTGIPKAVRITHGNLHANISAIAERGQLDPGTDVGVSWLPLFHDMGMIAFLTMPMALGLELVKITPGEFLSEPLIWARLLSKYGATFTGGPNFAYGLLAKQLGRSAEEFDLSALRIALNGAEPIDDRIVERFVSAGERFGLRPGSVLAAYGLAEVTLAASAADVLTGLEVDRVERDGLSAAGRAEPRADGARLSRLGRPLTGFEVAVLDADGNHLGERLVGELVARGPSVSPGYVTVDGPEPTTDAAGWLHTGDLGYLVGGQIVVCGRRKDVIILGGRNFYPAEIERAADSIPGVRPGNSAAVRIDSGDRREGFALLLESKVAGDSHAEDQLRSAVTAHVADVVGVRPAAVRILAPGTLPKTPSGKVQRAAAAARFAATGGE